MPSINITLPDSLYHFVNSKADEEGEFTSAAEYIRHVIRRAAAEAGALTHQRAFKLLPQEVEDEKELENEPEQEEE